MITISRCPYSLLSQPCSQNRFPSLSAPSKSEGKSYWKRDYAYLQLRLTSHYIMFSRVFLEGFALV